MPPTIVIPTQADLLRQQEYNATHSPMAVFNAYQAAKRGGGVGSIPTTPVTSLPGANPTTVNPLTPVNPLPTIDPKMTPQINYTPNNNLDWIKATTDMINQINQNAQQAANAGRIPGGAALEAASSKNIGNALSGALSQDVVNQIGQRAAERGVGSGSPWGANTNADYLKAIGLNSLQLQGTGQDWLTAALGRNPAAPIFDPSKLLITPTQATGFGLDQANLTLRQQEAITAAQNSNAQRQLQADLANASNALEREKILANYQNEELNRQNALRLAQLHWGNQGGGGSGYGPRGNQGTGAFNPATNWYTGGAPTMTATPTPQGWHLPYSLGNNNQLPDDYLDQFYGGTNPVTPTVTPTPTGDFGDWNNLLPPMNPPYQGPGDLSDEDYFNLYGG